MNLLIGHVLLAPIELAAEECHVVPDAPAVFGAGERAAHAGLTLLRWAPYLRLRLAPRRLRRGRTGSTSAVVTTTLLLRE